MLPEKQIRFKMSSLKSLKKLIIGQSNIRSLRNWFDLLTYQIENNKNLLMITETKLEENFPISQFFINSFSSPFRLDHDRNGGGILLCISEDIIKTFIYINIKWGRERHNFLLRWFMRITAWVMLVFSV